MVELKDVMSVEGVYSLSYKALVAGKFASIYFLMQDLIAHFAAENIMGKWEGLNE